MANDLKEMRTDTEPSVTSLVAGIVSDFQELMKQQLALFRHEVASDLTRTKEAALALAAGGIVAVVGVGLFVLMVVHLIQWATGWDLWICYGLVAAVFLVAGGLMMYLGKKKFESFNPLPDESAQALKENVQCLMNQK